MPPPDPPRRATAIVLQTAPTAPAIPSAAGVRAGARPLPGRWRGSLLAALPSVVIGLVWVLVASANSIGELATFNSTSRDIGVYLQMLWNTGHGRPFQITLLESNRIHLAEHVALLVPVLAGPFALWPDARWLFAAQTAVLALAGAPIYLLARRLLGGVLLPTLFVAAYFAMPALTEVAYDAFYPITWTALPIAFAAYFLLTDRVRPGVALAMLALPMEEEAGLAVLGLGLFLVLRRGRRRVGVALTVLAALWLGAIALVVMPRFHEPSTLPAAAQNRTVDHFAALRERPGQAIREIVGERLPVALRWLLAPTGGLPLAAPHVLVMDAPHAATLLLADKPDRLRRHWAAPMLPTLWLGAVVGLAVLRRPPLRAAGLALLLAGSVGTYLVDSNLPGGGDYDPADVVWSERAEQHAYLVQRVPAGASVAASRRALGHLADRAELYVFPPSYAGDLWPPERRVQAYLLDLTNDGTREALAGRQSPLRAGRPYAIWLAGPDAMLLLDRPPEPAAVLGRDVAGLRLLGLDTRQQGGTLEVEAHWQAPARVTRPMTRTVAVLGGDGAVLAEARGLALDEFLPVEAWPSGQVVIDRLRLAIPSGSPARLVLGWTDRNGTSETVEVPLGPAR